MAAFIDLTGQRFGRWLVVSRADNYGTRATWNCLCDCGISKRVNGSHLRMSVSRSCGCLNAEIVSAIHRTDGMGHTPEKMAWYGMVKRCYEPTFKSYPHYGGRGIKVCDRWRESFLAFYQDVGARPSPKHSLDRIDNNGNYEPGNCRWATKREQATNRRTSRLISHEGRTMCATDWARELGMQPATLLQRLCAGWPADKAITTPVRSQA